ncbi:5'-nucleotidase C-terminal domain-containing protein, partial [Escherichia coli]|uniref:5'-nucleotidase C-terminal domain-containing protein n=1 Tax=Escherichia coli TaxID=562 RepID=UPI0028DDA5D6
TATLPASAHAGKFPYGGHLRYTFTETTPGKRGTLTQLQWQDTDGQWQDLVDATRYRVVMNAYSANGNDGWQALARAQAQHAERQDLAWQDGKLTAFPVERVEQSGDQLSARYAAGHQLDCKASGMDCGTDAAS